MTCRQLLTAAQVAEACDVHRTTVNVWRHAGRLVPVAEANGIPLYDPDMVTALAAVRRSSPVPGRHSGGGT